MLPCAYRCDVPTRSLWTNLGAENGNNVTQRPWKQEMTPLLCSPEMTFLMSCSFARGAVTHLLSCRTEERNDFIRRVVPVRGRRRGEGQEARHPGSQSHTSFKQWKVAVREQFGTCLSLQRQRREGEPQRPFLASGPKRTIQIKDSALTSQTAMSSFLI